MSPPRLLALAAMIVVIGCRSGSQLAAQSDDRRADVAARSTRVMPFDLERTTHIFESMDDGGLQRVVSDDDDAEQIRLIRSHLSEEAGRFARGDFHDPERIHGEHMPGLHALVTGHERMSVTYREVDGGAQIRYQSDDAELIAAIHQWFEAQVADHGRHAREQR